MIEEKLKAEIPYRWKVQSFNKDKTKGSCVAYIDARDVMDVLDSAVGFDGWEDQYKYENGQWLCGITIHFENGISRTKWDTGIAGNMEAEKSAISDSFKRAAVKWGIGRFLYNLEIRWIDIVDKKPVDSNGNTIWDLTKHFNETNTKTIYKPKTQPDPNIRTEKQVETIKKLLIETRIPVEEMREKAGITEGEELTKQQAEKVITWLNGVLDARGEVN